MNDTPCPEHDGSEEIYEFLREETLDSAYEWIIQSGLYKDFIARESTVTKALWLRGPPRCGKSSAAAFLTSRLQMTAGENAIVAYYFFSASAGRTGTREAIRALSDQLQRACGVGSRPYVVPPNCYQPSHATRLSIKRLIKQYLQRYFNQDYHVYIIIDGLDEADFTRKDPVSQRPEIEELLRYLVTLATKGTRVLLASRPLATLAEFISEAIPLNLTFKEASWAISCCVENFMSKTPKTRNMFLELGIIPQDYFQSNFGGNLTWAQGALHTLSRITNIERFHKCLDALPQDTSVFMETYRLIVAGLDEAEEESLKALIYHLQVSGGSMWLGDLKSLVEKSSPSRFGDFIEYGDCFVDPPKGPFVDFLQVQCGPIVHIIRTEGIFIVDIVRFNNRCCQSIISESLFLSAQGDFYLSEALRVLRDLLPYPQKSNLSTGWTNPLPHAGKTGKAATHLLLYIHRLFNSTDVLIYWLRETLKADRPFSELPVSSLLRQDNPSVKVAIDNISEWLRKFQLDLGIDANDLRVQEIELKKAIEFPSKYSTPFKINMFLSRRAAAVVLYGKFPQELSEVDMRLMFSFAWRGYKKSKQKPTTCIADVVRTNFIGMIEWVGIKEDPNPACLGYLFYLLQEWEPSIACWTTVIETKERDRNLTILLARAYASQGKYLDAVNQYKKAVALGYGKHHAWADAASLFRQAADADGFSAFAKEIGLSETVGFPSAYDSRMISAMDVYMEGGDYRNAIRAFDDIEEGPVLLEAYDAINYDDEEIIPNLELRLEIWPEEYKDSLFQSLYKAYIAKKESSKALDTLQRAIKCRPNPYDFIIHLAEEYIKSGNGDEAINVLGNGIQKFPTSPSLWVKLFQVLAGVCEYAEVEMWYHKLQKSDALKTCSTWFSIFLHACRAMGEAHEIRGSLDQAVQCYEEALKGSPEFRKLWKQLRRLCAIRKNVSRQVEMIKLLLEKVEQNRKDDSHSLKKQFLKDFLSEEPNGTVENFALWFDLKPVWQIVRHGCVEKYPCDWRGWNPLHIAAHEGYKDMVKLILSESWDYMAQKDSEGRTPLHLAAMNGDLEIVERLVDGGAEIGARDSIGFTALHYAIENCNWDVQNYLVRCVIEYDTRPTV